MNAMFGSRRAWIPVLLFLSLTTFDSNRAAVRSALAHDGIEAVDSLDAAGSEFFDLEGDGLEEDDFAAAAVMSDSAMPARQYDPPSAEGLHFAETFDGDWKARWSRSTNEKFEGRWERVVRKMEALKGDYGIRTRDKARHHAMASRFPATSSVDKEFIVSYEVKFEDGITCGGAYLKLFDSQGMDLADFDNETPYVIMFGPDKCGSTNKVHAIIKSKNPISGEWNEHHLKNPATLPADADTHQFALRLLPNDTYEVYVDGEVARNGSMHEDFEPPFTPPQEIDDPSDFKPEDWVDEAKVADPTAVKPDDWDEDAPAKIPDPDATIPEGWLEDAEAQISDPEAIRPSDWDDEEDGDWFAPMIPNPLCSVGCGPWAAPVIPNPEYKGRWMAPMIANPDYIGVWAPRKIPNENFFVNEHPHHLSSTLLNAVGFELWTMDEGYLFDNIVVAHSWDATSSFLDASYRLRQPIEASHRAPKQKTDDPLGPPSWTSAVEGFLAGIMSEFPFQVMVFGGCAVIILFSLSWFVLSKQLKGSGEKVADKEAAKKASTKKETAKSDTEDETTPRSTGKSHDRDSAGDTKVRKRGGRPVQAD